MSSTIRRAERADLASLQPIERAASGLFPEGRIPDVDNVMPLCDLEHGLEDQSLLVATSHGLVVGFAMAKELDRCFHLAVMAVHPDHGRRGFGRELVLAVSEEAARRRLPAVTLTTFDDLPWNGPFYRSAGFRVLGDGELSSALRDILAHEGQLGMVNRVAMRHVIAT